MQCAVCKREIPEGKDSCEKCGNRILKCRKCGHDVLPNETRCSQCNAKCKRVTNKNVWGGFGVVVGFTLVCMLLAFLLYGKVESLNVMVFVPVLLLAPGMVFPLLAISALWQENVNVQKASVLTYYIGSEKLNRILIRFYLIAGVVCLMLGMVAITHCGSSFFYTWSAPGQVATKFLNSKGEESLQYVAPEAKEEFAQKLKNIRAFSPEYPSDKFRTQIRYCEFEGDDEAVIGLYGSTNRFIVLKKIDGQWLITTLDGFAGADAAAAK